jgi:hypothetical protein
MLARRRANRAAAAAALTRSRLDPRSSPDPTSRSRPRKDLKIVGGGRSGKWARRLDIYRSHSHTAVGTNRRGTEGNTETMEAATSAALLELAAPEAGTPLKSTAAVALPAALRKRDRPTDWDPDRERERRARLRGQRSAEPGMLLLPVGCSGSSSGLRRHDMT